MPIFLLMFNKVLQNSQVRFVHRAFYSFFPISYPNSTQEALNFWTDLWSLLSVLWLGLQSDAQIKWVGACGGGLHFLYVSPLPCLSTCSFFIVSALSSASRDNFRWSTVTKADTALTGKQALSIKSGLHICLCLHWNLYRTHCNLSSIRSKSKKIQLTMTKSSHDLIDRLTVD